MISFTKAYNNTDVNDNTHLFHVDFKRSQWLTFGTRAWLDFLVLWLVERPEDKAALVTVVLDDAELRQDPSGTGHHTAGANQLVQVKLSTNKKGHAFFLKIASSYFSWMFDNLSENRDRSLKMNCTIDGKTTKVHRTAHTSQSPLSGANFVHEYGITLRSLGSGCKCRTKYTIWLNTGF